MDERKHHIHLNSHFPSIAAVSVALIRAAVTQCDCQRPRQQNELHNAEIICTYRNWLGVARVFGARAREQPSDQTNETKRGRKKVDSSLFRESKCDGSTYVQQPREECRQKSEDGKNDTIAWKMRWLGNSSYNSQANALVEIICLQHFFHFYTAPTSSRRYFWTLWKKTVCQILGAFSQSPVKLTILPISPVHSHPISRGAIIFLYKCKLYDIKRFREAHWKHLDELTTLTIPSKRRNSLSPEWWKLKWVGKKRGTTFKFNKKGSAYSASFSVLPFPL